MSRRCCATPRASPSPTSAHAGGQRPDGVEYRRSVVPDQGIGGRSLDVPIISSAPTGTWRVAAFTDPKQPADRRGDLPGRGLCAGSARIRSHHHGHQHFARLARRRSMLDGRFLYGAPASGLDARRRDQHRQGDRAAGLCRLRVRPRRRQRRRTGRSSPTPFRSPTCPRPTAPAKRASPSTLDKVPASTRPQQAEIVVRMAEARRPRGRAQAHAADHAVSDP